MRTYGQAEHARTLSSGNCSALYREEISLYNNPAGIAESKGLTSFLTYQAAGLIRELDYRSGGIVYDLPNKGIGLLIHQTGDQRLSFHGIDLAYAQKFGKSFSIGAKLEFKQLKFSDIYGHKLIFTGSMGFITGVSEAGSFSFFIRNPDRQVLYHEYHQRIPAEMCLGYRHMFSQKFVTAVEVSVISNQPVNMKIGADYHAFRQIQFRLGFQSLYRQFSFGTGIEWKKKLFELALLWQQDLGFTSAISINLKFGKKENT